MERVMKMLLVLGLFLTLGCATGDIVKPFLKNPEFQAENLPIRDLQIAVAYDKAHPKEKLEATINEASNLLEEQVGIRLIIKYWVPIRLNSRDSDGVLNALSRATFSKIKDFDVAIGFTYYVFGWEGVIDTTSRYIFIKKLRSTTIVHEVCHAFLDDHSHSSIGVMQAVPLYFPGVILPIGASLMTPYLSVEDRKMILKNKWKKFR